MIIIPKVDQVTVGIMSKEPASSADISFVYKNTGGQYQLVADGALLSRVEVRGHKYTLRYSVARGTYEYRHEAEYSSKDPGRMFHIQIQMNVSVMDPIAVVRNDIRNLEQFLNANIHFWLQPLSESYGIGDFNEVRNKMQKIEQQTSIMQDLNAKGLHADQLKASVRLSDGDGKHFQQIDELRKQKELEIAKLQQQKEILEMTAELNGMKAHQDRELLKQQKNYDDELEAERKKRLMDAIALYGPVLGAIIEGSASNEEIRNIFLEEYKNRRDFRDQMTKTAAEKGWDSEDVRVILELDHRMSKDFGSQTKEPIQSSGNDKAFGWSEKRQAEDINNNDKEWVD